MIIDKSKFKIYSKKGCSPCEFLKRIASEKLNHSDYLVIEFETDDEVLSVIDEYEMKTVPFIVTKDEEVITFKDSFRYINKLVKNT